MVYDVLDYWFVVDEVIVGEGQGEQLVDQWCFLFEEGVFVEGQGQVVEDQVGVEGELLVFFQVVVFELEGVVDDY